MFDNVRKWAVRAEIRKSEQSITDATQSIDALTIQIQERIAARDPSARYLVNERHALRCLIDEVETYVWEVSFSRQANLQEYFSATKAMLHADIGTGVTTFQQTLAYGSAKKTLNKYSVGFLTRLAPQNQLLWNK